MMHDFLVIPTECEKLSWYQCRWSEGEKDPDLSFVSIPPILKEACPSRRIDFVMGRLCAHKALQALRSSLKHPFYDQPIAIGSGGEPQWPSGIVGSISHTLDTACAVVASKQFLLGIGIDLQAFIRSDQLEDLEETVATSREIDKCPNGVDKLRYITLLFAAKEAVYKAYFPIEQSAFDYCDIETRFDGLNTFSFTFLGDFSILNRRNYNAKGYFDFEPTMVRTLVLLRRPS